MAALCFKCKRASGTISSRDGAAKAYCKECFIEFCTHVIRDTLFKHCGMPSDEPLAVAVSGGHNSMVLLHQLGVLRMQNRLRPGKGHVDFVVCPLHLREDELIVPPSLGSESDLAKTMTEQFEKLEAEVRQQSVQWEFASVPLFTSDELRVVWYSDFLSSDEMDILRGVLHHPRLSLSDRELLHAKLRQRVLAVAAASCINDYKHTRRAAREESVHPVESETAWHHLMTGDNALRCCVTAMREVMTGGGANVMHHSGYRGFLNHCVLMHPLRTMLPREMALYCRAQDIWAGYSPSLRTLTSLRSIDRTLEAFFNGLMRAYRASVFNVLSAVAKLEAGAEPQLLRADLSRPGPGPGPKANAGPGPVPEAGSGPGPVPEAGSGPGPVPEAGSGPGPVPEAGSGPGPVPEAGSGPGPVPEAGSGPGPGPKAGPGAGPRPLPAKRVIPGRTAAHHAAQLRARAPPRYRHAQRCVLCGCVAPLAEEADREEPHGVCEACKRFLEGLPDDVAEGGALAALEALDMRLEALAEAADALAAGKENDERNVRRRTGEDDGWKSYIIPNDNDDNDKR